MVHLVAEQDQVPPVAAPGLNVCVGCDDRMRADLRLIADRWEEAQDALHPSSGGGDSERHAGRVEPPLPLDVSVSDALRIVRDDVWSVALRLVDDHDGLALPADQTTPSLAEWMAKWQLIKIAGSADKGWSREAYWLIASAADQITAVTHGVETRVDMPAMFCKHKTHVDMKTSVCGAQLMLAERPDGVKTVRCNEDVSHAVPWDIWSQALRASRPQRRGARLPRASRV
ncbi:hypothetical protein GCM10007173_36780 [Glutamicibacter ardleyensis]|uniref:DUF222 domain-containing protein n=1 Tax=Glutamicibacter ardleyensis TaxID=225894 RepID=A0ABQ2DZX0_9MICC|nr:hypothetical protein GCM10007173_36780 [Glutamicibacter ardleyensis]